MHGQMLTAQSMKEPEDTLILPVRTGKTELAMPVIEELVVPADREHGERAGAIDVAVNDAEPGDFVRFMQAHWVG